MAGSSSPLLYKSLPSSFKFCLSTFFSFLWLIKWCSYTQCVTLLSGISLVWLLIRSHERNFSLWLLCSLCTRCQVHRIFHTDGMGFASTVIWYITQSTQSDKPKQAYKHIMIGPAMRCKQNNRITIIEEVNDIKNLPYYSSLHSCCFSKTTITGSIIDD